MGPVDTPPDSPRAAPALVDHFFRHEYGRLTAQLTRRYGVSRLELVEDAVQSALMSALGAWTKGGLPKNPAAWLNRVANNRVVDELRKRGRQDLTAQPTASEPPAPEEARAHFGQEIEDDELRMLFVCCDPALPGRTQLVLALKILCGFSVREIATRLFLSEENTQKILSRGRARLRDVHDGSEPGFRELSPAAHPERLQAVHAVVYLLFNEGYSSQREDEAIVRELCEEALRLAQHLLKQAACETPETYALLALMHFHMARLDARRDGAGNLLLLMEQDRSAWDARHIQLGMYCLMQASQGGRFSRYLGEAAILSEHCCAPSFEQTRWHEIVDLYELLEQHAPSPLHTVGRAIALAEWRGAEAGLSVLQSMAVPPWLRDYYLYDATLGELLRRAGHFESASPHLRRAIAHAPTRAERTVFERRLRLCVDGRTEREG